MRAVWITKSRGPEALVIDALGEGSQELAPGQRVLAMTHFGGHADVVCVPPSRCCQSRTR